MRHILNTLGAALALTVSLPLWPIIIAAIKLETSGPAFVRLPRVSKGKLIYAYKFRSMIDGAHFLKSRFVHLNERQDGPFFKIKEDPRLTKVGKFIRKFRFDELPQFLNVLKGELALVGPRPHEPEEVVHYPDEYKHLILVKAGVTGLSQVSGSSKLLFLKELELDDFYVKNRNLAMDLKILGKTVKIFFSDPTAV